MICLYLDTKHETFEPLCPSGLRNNQVKLKVTYSIGKIGHISSGPIIYRRPDIGALPKRSKTWPGKQPRPGTIAHLPWNTFPYSCASRDVLVFAAMLLLA